LKRSTKILLRIVLGVVLILGILITSSLFLINSDWLKDKIVAKVNESMDAELGIESLEFKLLSGRVNLSGVRFCKKQENSDLKADIENINVQLRIFPLLLFKQVRVQDLEINKPVINCTLEKTHGEETKTIEKLEQLIIWAITKTIQKIIEAVLDFLGLISNEKLDVHIAKLTVHQGILNLRVLNKEGEEFKAKVWDIEYHSRSIVPISATEFMKKADIDAVVDLGQGKAIYHQHLSSKPYKVTLEDFNVGYFDKAANKTDALIVNSGTAKLTYDQDKVRLLFTGLELEKNTSAKYPDFFFVGVDRVIKYVEESGGKLDFGCTFDSETSKISSDVHFVIREVLKGFLIQAKERYGSELVGSVLNKGKSAVDKGKEFLENREETKNKIRSFFEKIKPETEK